MTIVNYDTPSNSDKKCVRLVKKKKKKKNFRIL